MPGNDMKISQTCFWACGAARSRMRAGGSLETAHQHGTVDDDA
jgi:hypothetical protein